MIPVLICPTLNRPDLTAQMLASINMEVGRLILIDNSVDGSATKGLEWPTDHVFVQLHHNIGVGAAWNLGIKMTPLADWWCIVNNDLVFDPTDLPRLAYQMGGHPDGMAMLGSLAAFGVSHTVIEQAGWFEESFVPAYHEDNDFCYRLRLLGIPYEALPGNYTHQHSSTINSDPRLWMENNRTFQRNEAYYKAKWGGAPLHESFPTPFNFGGSPKDWQLNLARLRELTWRL